MFMGIQQEVTNSCKTKRGCDCDRVTLPWDSLFIIVRGRMPKPRNDTRKVSGMADLLVDKMAKKAA